MDAFFVAYTEAGQRRNLPGQIGHPKRLLLCFAWRYADARWVATRHILKFCSGYPLRIGIDEKDPSPSQKQSAPVYLFF